MSGQLKMQKDVKECNCDLYLIKQLDRTIDLTQVSQDATLQVSPERKYILKQAAVTSFLNNHALEYM